MQGSLARRSEYVRQLIRKDQINNERVAIDKLLVEALDSELSPMTKADWEHIRQEVDRRIAEQSGQ